MLILAIVLIALILPILMLAEMWRTRRVALPADAPDSQLDPVLSTSGMSRKILFSMVLLVESFLLLIAYGVNEPARQQAAAARQLEFAMEQGAHTYVQYCLSCHGPQGRGYLENVGLPGKPLNRPDLQTTDPDGRREAVKLISQTIEHGRAGTVMPAWGVVNGGPLNYAMINELVALIVEGRWDLVTNVMRHDGIPAPTEPPIVDPVATGRLIVTQGACASCHAIANTPAQGRVGPPLDGIASRQIAGVLPFTRENVRQWVANPNSVKPGTPMPPYPLREAHLDAIAAYLDTLR